MKTRKTKKRELESKIEGWLRNEVFKRGGLYYKFNSPGNIGVPDRIILYNGKTWFVELKQASGELSKIQCVQIERMERVGAKVRVIYGREGARRLLGEVFSEFIPTEERGYKTPGLGIEEWKGEKRNWSDRG